MITGALPYNNKAWRAVRPVKAPLMTEIKLLFICNWVRAVRPLKFPLLMAVILLPYKCNCVRAIRPVNVPLLMTEI